MIYYSEFGEDNWIDTNLKLPERGFYLDIGCGHPERDSNTAFLRDRGWLGIAIDAVEEYGPHWIGRQQFIRALISSKSKVKFKYIPHNSAVSRVCDDPDARVRNGVTLEHILNQTFRAASPPITRIDLMSVDVEGQEFEVFQTFDWKTWLPSIIVAEYNTEGIGEDFRLSEMLCQSGLYKVAHGTKANLIFIRT